MSDATTETATVKSRRKVSKKASKKAANKRKLAKQRALEKRLTVSKKTAENRIAQVLELVQELSVQQLSALKKAIDATIYSRKQMTKAFADATK
jgi:ribosomal protein L18